MTAQLSGRSTPTKDDAEVRKPLISRQSSRFKSTRPRREKFPTKQLFFLALVRFSEPIVFTSIFPYIYFMIARFGIAKDESNEIAIYASLITSAFTFAEFTTGMFWGHMSDRYGRKPVLIFGLIGTLLSIVAFGLSTSFPMALLARAIGGALNGNQGVIQTAVAELVEGRPEWQSQAFAVLPFVWCLGSILGPAVGGLLAEPADRYPSFFSKDGLFGQFPYLLPGLVCAGILIVGIVIGWLFLEETHEELGKTPDLGRKVGESIVKFCKSAFGANAEVIKHAEEEVHNDSDFDNYKTFIPPSVAAPAEDPLPLPHAVNLVDSESSKTPKQSAFNWPIIHLIISYGILATHTISYEQLFPVFLSTPRNPEKPHNPFLFSGGFSYTTQDVGVILSVQGILSLCSQLIYHPIVSRFGPLKVYRYVLLFFPVVYFVVPYLLFLPQGASEQVGIYGAVIIKIIFSVLAYPSNAILLTNSCESALVLGKVNGAASSVASMMRTIGPVVAGTLYSLGSGNNCVGLAWWVLALVCVAGAWQAWSFKIHDEDEEGYTEEVEQ